MIINPIVFGTIDITNDGADVGENKQGTTQLVAVWAMTPL